MGRENLHVLIISPHTDDAELGCGGTILRHIEAGDKVTVVVVSPCKHVSEEIRFECQRSIHSLGADLVMLPYETRTMREHAGDILNVLISIRDRIRPSVVYCPSADDKHQDHRAVYEECRRAFRCTIYGYVFPWNVTTSHPARFVSLKEGHIVRKLEALSNYKSQMSRPYFAPDFIHGWARTTGVQAGVEYAEAFEVIREVWA